MIINKDEAIKLLIESQESIGGDWRVRRDAVVAKALAATSHIAPDAAVQAEGAVYVDASALKELREGTWNSVCTDIYRLPPCEGPAPVALYASPAIAPEASELPPKMQLGENALEYVNGWNACRAAIAMAAAATDVTVHVDRNRVFITKGVQSFMLAYEADTADELNWYADQLRKALASKAAAEPVPTIASLIETHGSILHAANEQSRLAAKPAASEAVGVLARAIDCLEILNQRPRPMCRDCADSDGTCPNGGLECDMRKLISDARMILAAPAAPTDAGVRDKALEDAAKACEAWGNEKVAKWQGDPDMSADAKARAWDGLQCASAIRALKSSPQAPKTEGSE